MCPVAPMTTTRLIPTCPFGTGGRSPHPRSGEPGLANAPYLSPGTADTLEIGIPRWACRQGAGPRGAAPGRPRVERGGARKMADIVLDQVSKVYSGGVSGVDDLSLEIGDGEFMVLVGPSGCGKSTALRS